MKNFLSLLFLIFFFAVTINAQGDRQERNAKIEAMRAAYITEKLALTVEESQMFWPIFNEYEASRKEIQKSYDRRKDIESMTDAEAEVFLTQSFVKDQEMLDLKRVYFEKFKTAISVKKIAQLPRIEKRFRQELLKRMKRGREGKEGQQGRTNRHGGGE